MFENFFGLANVNFLARSYFPEQTITEDFTGITTLRTILKRDGLWNKLLKEMTKIARMSKECPNKTKRKI